jgi:ribosomal protein L11 methylase PrmA
MSLLGIIDSLESTIRKLKWQAEGTEWADYYTGTNYSSDAFEQKKQIVSDFLNIIKPKTVWDLGANDGTFSRIASDKGLHTISFDIDPAAVEKSYLRCMKNSETNILPLLLDLTNPSPGIGWENQERMSLLNRSPVDAAFALALIHHLAISNNLPFNKIAIFFKNICKSLIIEYVSKSDSQVQKLLSTREDIFPDYTKSIFESNFEKYFEIKKSVNIQNSDRTMYLMERK